MTELMPRRRYQRRRPHNPRATATVHLMVSIGLLFVGLILTDVTVQAFQASMGDGTPGTYTVTGITGGDRMLHGTFISTNRQVVIKNMGYNGNPPLSVGTTVKAIKPSWSWLGLNGESIYGPGRNPADIAWLALGGVMALVGLVYLAWSTRHLIRTRRTSPVTATRRARPGPPTATIRLQGPYVSHSEPPVLMATVHPAPNRQHRADGRGGSVPRAWLRAAGRGGFAAPAISS